MEYSKNFFGKTTLDSNDSEELNVGERIELEYYETQNTETEGKEYGIEVLKKDVKLEKFNIETKVVNNISDEENTVNRLLEILMTNKVTPVSVDDVISDTMALY